MCLAKVTRRHNPPKFRKQSLVAFKILDLHNDIATNDLKIVTPFQHVPIPANVWNYVAPQFHVQTESKRQTYPLGFHVYATRKDAKQALKMLMLSNKADLYVVPVNIREVVATGFDGTGGSKHPVLSRLPNLVARQMWVDNEVAARILREKETK